MISRLKLLFLLLLLAPHQALALGAINIMADNSLSIAITKIARDYSREHEIAVTVSFAPIKAQQAQITEGGAADVLVTPQQSWIDELKLQGLIDIYSQTEIAKNRLALVGPADSTLEVDLRREFPTAAMIRALDWEPGLLIGNPETLPEGSFGKEAMRSLGASEDMEPYTLYVKRLDQMFDAIANSKDFGIFFYSTATGRPGIRILDVFPESTHKPIQYFAVVIASEHMNEARQFLNYLKSVDAQRVFRENGLAL